MTLMLKSKTMAVGGNKVIEAEQRKNDRNECNAIAHAKAIPGSQRPDPRADQRHHLNRPTRAEQPRAGPEIGKHLANHKGRPEHIENETKRGGKPRCGRNED